MYPGQHMSIEDNIFYAKRNIVDSIWKEANIEGETVMNHVGDCYEYTIKIHSAAEI